jgi:hypothetical protein
MGEFRRLPGGWDGSGIAGSRESWQGLKPDLYLRFYGTT